MLGLLVVGVLGRFSCIITTLFVAEVLVLVWRELGPILTDKSPTMIFFLLKGTIGDKVIVLVTIVT